jgi:hypothetical protein
VFFDPSQHGLDIDGACRPGVIWGKAVIREYRNDALTREPSADVAVKNTVTILVTCDKASTVDVHNDRSNRACWPVHIQTMSRMLAVNHVRLFCRSLAKVKVRSVNCPGCCQHLRIELSAECADLSRYFFGCGW